MQTVGDEHYKHFEIAMEQEIQVGGGANEIIRIYHTCRRDLKCISYDARFAL